VEYYTQIMLLVAGQNGVVVPEDIFNLYEFLEIGHSSSRLCRRD
jgi:formate hydrogenlyase subunit 3/multisubunit Na+/H+ antiporter MnhD subunit